MPNVSWSKAYLSVPHPLLLCSSCSLVPRYLCAPPGLLWVYLFDAYGDGWGDSAYFSISYVGNPSAPTAISTYQIFNSSVTRYNTSGVVQLFKSMPSSAGELKPPGCSISQAHALNDQRTCVDAW